VGNGDERSRPWGEPAASSYLNDCRCKETNFGARTFLEFVPVGIDPNTGEIIYEPREIQQPALPDLQYTTANVRVGMTFFGSLW